MHIWQYNKTVAHPDGMGRAVSDLDQIWAAFVPESAVMREPFLNGMCAELSFGMWRTALLMSSNMPGSFTGSYLTLGVYPLCPGVCLFVCLFVRSFACLFACPCCCSLLSLLLVSIAWTNVTEKKKPICSSEGAHHWWIETTLPLECLWGWLCACMRAWEFNERGELGWRPLWARPDIYVCPSCLSSRLCPSSIGLEPYV